MTLLSKLTIIISISLALMFFGCSGKKVQKVEETNQELTGAPTWVTAPSVDGHIASVGVAYKSDYDFRLQRDSAKELTYEELSTKLTSRINRTIIELYQNGENWDTDSIINELEEVTADIVKNSMKSSKITELFKSQTGSIYLLGVVQIDIVKDEMQKLLSNSFKQTPHIYESFLSVKQDGRLDIKLKTSE